MPVLWMHLQLLRCMGCSQIRRNSQAVSLHAQQKTIAAMAWGIALQPIWGLQGNPTRSGSCGLHQPHAEPPSPGLL